MADLLIVLALLLVVWGSYRIGQASVTVREFESHGRRRL